MKMFLLLLVVGQTFLQFSYSQTVPRWRTLPNSPTSAGKHEDIFFINANVGWLGASLRQLYKTTNGGGTWQLKYTHPAGIRSIGFADSVCGWMGSLDSSNSLYSTTDGGNSWVRVDNFTGLRPAGICGIWVFNQDIVFALGRYFGPPRFLKTTNRGNSWEVSDLSSLAFGLVDCYFLTPDSGFIVGARGNSFSTGVAVVLFTSNGGVSWITKFVGSRSGEICWKMSFPSPNVGFISIASSVNMRSRYFLQTTDRGVTWQERLFLANSNYLVEGVGFATENVGWMGGDFTTYETSDGGSTWFPATFGRSINRFRMLSDTLGYACGERVYKFSRDSTVVNVDNIEDSPRKFRLEQNYPNPFNPTTTIRFDIALEGLVSLKVFDTLGKQVGILVDEKLQMGSYSRVLDAVSLPSGVYFYRLIAGRNVETKKMILIR